MRRWQDWASFALGLWLAVSPWIADYAGQDAATANAAVCGLALALAAHYGFSCDHLSTEWLTLAGGLWLIASPFALGFATNHVATVNTVAVGLFVTLLSAWALELDRELGRLWNRLVAH
ncbi:MAG TPA: SPW repeat protein [Burkholderiales bacterium]|nr:SPW repeat protein [Burkholderiales bacterium]